jgi:hypothetical protein
MWDSAQIDHVNPAVGNECGNASHEFGCGAKRSKLGTSIFDQLLQYLRSGFLSSHDKFGE